MYGSNSSRRKRGGGRRRQRGRLGGNKVEEREEGEQKGGYSISISSGSHGHHDYRRGIGR